MNPAKRKKLFRLGIIDNTGNFVKEEVQASVTLPEPKVEVEVKVEPQPVVEEAKEETQPVVEETVVQPKTKKVKKVVESE